MSVSIIIPTYNGALKIPHLLKALEGQSFTDFEVIVVIDGSTDHTYELINEANYQLKNLQLIRQLNGGRSVARNTGAEKAQGDILIFFDDDVVPLHNTVELHVKHHANFKQSILVGDVIMDNRNSKNDFYNYRYYIENTWRKSIKENFYAINFNNLRFTTQNLSLSKKNFLSLEGFNKQLNDSEDFDLCVRALLNKIPIYYDKNIFAWHGDFLNMKQYIVRQKEYRVGKRAIFKIHPEYCNLFPDAFLFMQPVSNTRKIISLFFTYNSIWRQLVLSNWFVKLVPEKYRFRLYEIIIYCSTLNH